MGKDIFLEHSSYTNPSTRFRSDTHNNYDFYKTHNNIVEKNGRIKRAIVLGETTSLSIPQYLDNFKENIETGILSVVLSLVEKNYMLISSCEGHGIFLRTPRYVTLCFNNSEQLDIFKKAFLSCNFVQFSEYILYANHRPKTEASEIEKKQEIKFLNTFFKRDSTYWIYLELSLGLYFLNSKTKKILDVITNLPMYSF